MANIMEYPRVLLVPVYNPGPGWENTFVDRYNLFCQSLKDLIPVVLVNDGSTKDIREDVQFIKQNIGEYFFYIDCKINKGKGAALKEAAKMLDADAYIFTDADFPYTNESMQAVLLNNELNKGVTMGVRDENYYNDVSFFRMWLSKLLKKLNQFLLRLPSNDTQCGLKAFDRNGRDILIQCETNRFLIDLEFLFAAHQKKINITPVIVKLRDDVVFTQFNTLILLKEFKNFILLIWRFRVKKIFS